MDGLGDRHGGHTAAPRSLDSGSYEGGLETSDRGDWALGCVLAELESNESGAPARVLPLELAGELEQLLGLRGDRAPTGAIVGSQALAIGLAGQPPDVADRPVGDRQLGRDLGQGVTLLMTSHDLLTERDREWARHGSRLRSSKKRDQLLTSADVTHAEK